MLQESARALESSGQSEVATSEIRPTKGELKELGHDGSALAYQQGQERPNRAKKLAPAQINDEPGLPGVL